MAKLPFLIDDSLITVIKSINKTMERHFLPTLVDAIIIIATFDLWMSQKGFDMFVLIVNYINKKWEPCHVIMGIFEVHETSGTPMVVHFKDLLAQYNLLNKIIAYVKNKSANLNTFIVALINIVSCVSFLLPQPYATSCYGHAMSKCCQYVTNDLKMCGGMKGVSIKKVQSSFQKTIIWTQKK